MSVIDKLARAGRENAPAILTAVSVVGVAASVYLTARATVVAVDLIRHEETVGGAAEEGWPRFKERFHHTWRLYVPALSVAAVTCASVVWTHRLTTRRQAAMVGLYAMADKAFSDYRTKVTDILGENKEREVRDEMAKERIEAQPVSQSHIYMSGSDDQLCYDGHTGRYFKCDIETIRKAQNDINQTIINNMYASLNDFYRLIGLGSINSGEDVGWNTDNMMDISFSSHLTDTGVPCLSIDYNVAPSPGYFKAL